jgi:long-chain acyl-CoA synthetase
LDAVAHKAIETEIVEGMLWVKSPGSTKSEESSDGARPGWVNTGDEVEVRDGRIYILGRASECINVGGNNVFPQEVEQAIRSVAGVQDAHVYPTPSSMVGQIVTADVVAKVEADPAILRVTITKELGQTLERYKIPRVLRFVDELELSAAQKIKR